MNANPLATTGFILINNLTLPQMLTGSITLQILSGFLSIAGIAYFLTLLKVKAINTHFKGSWKVYLKSIFKTLCKK